MLGAPPRVKVPLCASPKCAAAQQREEGRTGSLWSLLLLLLLVLLDLLPQLLHGLLGADAVGLGQLLHHVGAGLGRVGLVRGAGLFSQSVHLQMEDQVFCIELT